MVMKKTPSLDRLWRLARQRNAALGIKRDLPSLPGPPSLPGLWMMTDPARAPDPLAAAGRLPRGAGVILRHYGAPERRALARRLAHLCRQRGLVLLIAGDWRLALAVGAQGVHLPEGLTGMGGVRRRPGWIVTSAAHSRGALVAATRAGVDAVLLSPAFTTASHPGARALGTVRFCALSRATGVPVYALGGITAATARRLAGARLIGFAAIGALCGDFPLGAAGGQ
jgi:thiamine-phosphate pyrophosphorylase